MVFLHELGHFLAAKAARGGVEVFSLGWGPKLLGVPAGRHGDRLSWLPIGGTAGSGATRGCAVRSSRTSTGCRTRRDRSTRCPRGGGILVVVAGPVASLLSAFLIFALIGWVGFRRLSSDNRIVLATDYTLSTFIEPPPGDARQASPPATVSRPSTAGPVRNFREIQEIVRRAPTARWASRSSAAGSCARWPWRRLR